MADLVDRMKKDHEDGIGYDKNAKPRHKQIVISQSDKRFLILVKHPDSGHWCGYVMMDEGMWKLMDQYGIRACVPEKVSFAGYANKYISWMTHNANGDLSVPATLTGNEDGDFWIGFDTFRNGNPAEFESVEQVEARTIEFEKAIWNFMVDHFS